MRPHPHSAHLLTSFATARAISRCLGYARYRPHTSCVYKQQRRRMLCQGWGAVWQTAGSCGSCARCGQATSVHVCVCVPRSKEDILSEIRRLQAEMSALEDRVQSSAKMMNGNGTTSQSHVTVLPAASITASAAEDVPQDSKDK